MPRPTRRSPFPLAAAGLLAAAAAVLWAASPRAPGQPPGDSEAAGGPFAVAGGATPILLDTATGDAWALARLGPGEHVWLPTERVTDPARAAELRGRLRKDGAANGDGGDANGGGPTAAAAEPAGGAYFPGHLLGGDVIHGDLIGGDLVGGSLVGEALIGGAVVDGPPPGERAAGDSAKDGEGSEDSAGGSD